MLVVSLNGTNIEKWRIYLYCFNTNTASKLSIEHLKPPGNIITELFSLVSGISHLIFAETLKISADTIRITS